MADDLRQQRLRKLEALRGQGVDPYPPRVDRTHTAAEALAAFDKGYAGEVRAAGRILSVRYMGKASFCHVADGSGKIQVFLRRDALGDEKYDFFKEAFDIGDFIAVSGTLFKTRTGETTIEVKDLTMLSKALLSLPGKWHGLTDVEKRYRQRYLDLISNQDVRRIFLLRSASIAAMRRFLN